MQWFRLSRRRVLMSGAALGLAAAARPRFALAEAGGALRVRSYADLQVLDPAHRKSQPEGDIMRCIYTKLIDYKTGDEWGWRPTGAAAIEQVDPTHVKFTLRPGIMFTNGFGEMTAEDVKFSYERIANPAEQSEYADDFSQLDHVEVQDKLTGVIVLKQPFAPLWTSSLPAGSGCVVSKAAVEKVGGSFTTDPPATAGHLRHQAVAAQAEADPHAQSRLERRARRLRGDPDPADRGREGGRDRLRGGRARLHCDQRQLDPDLRGEPAGRRQGDPQALARLRLARHERRCAALRRREGAARGAAGCRCRRGAGSGLFRRRRPGDRDRRPRPDRPPAEAPERSETRPRGVEGAADRGRLPERLQLYPRHPEQDRAAFGGPGDPGEPRAGRHPGADQPARIRAPSGCSAARRMAISGRRSS